MKRISVLLIVATLIAGMLGCDSGESYTLAITSTGGGSVAIPGEGILAYGLGIVVNLVAEAEEGYRFINWTGDVGTLADVEAASTNITMNGDCIVLANFGDIPPLQYNISINSAEGGFVFWPGEGLFTYDEGTVVGLVAESEEGYRFTNWTGDVDTIGNVEAAETTITMDDSYSITANFGEDIAMVAAGNWHTVGLRGDGTVVAVGRNIEGQCDVGGWTNITQVAAGYSHTVGLKSDGTVVAVGFNGYGQCDVSSWTDIVQVAGGEFHTVGLKSDGTVVAAGGEGHDYGQCNVELWTNITQVTAGSMHTVGLTSEDTVVAVGLNNEGQCDVDGWDLN